MINKDIIFDNLSILQKNKFNRHNVRVYLYKDGLPVIEFDYQKRRFGIDVSPASESKVSIETHWRANAKQYQYFLKKSLIVNLNEIDSVIQSIQEEFYQFIDKHGSKLLDIIVPIYNREDLVLDLIESLNKQTLDKSYFNVIFVDDCSTDKSIQTIKKLAKFNFELLTRSIASGNASAPRNEGIKAAKADYILFVDSDDYLHHLALEGIFKAINTYKSDIIYLKTEGVNGRKCAARTYSGKANVENATIFGNALLLHGFPCKVFKTSLIRDNNIYYDRSFKLEEDKLFLFECLALSKKVSILKDKSYVYLTNHESEHLGQSKDTSTYRIFKLWTYLLGLCLRIPDERKKKEFYNGLLFRFARSYEDVFSKRHSRDYDLILEFFYTYSHLYDKSLIYIDGQSKVESLFMHLTKNKETASQSIGNSSEKSLQGNEIYLISQTGEKRVINQDSIKKVEIIFKG